MIYKSIQITPGKVVVETTRQGDDPEITMGGKQTFKNLPIPPKMTQAWNALALMSWDVFGFNDVHNRLEMDDNLTQTEVSALQNLETMFSDIKDKARFILKKVELKKENDTSKLYLTVQKPNRDGELCEMKSHGIDFLGETSLGYEPELKARWDDVKTETTNFLWSAKNDHQLELFPEGAALKTA